MSDRSSESSCEWVLLNEDKEIENEVDEQAFRDEQPQNLALSYDAVCDAVSDSIKSSLSSEELEWQCEQFQDYLLQYEQFHMEDLNAGESDVDSNRSEDSNAEDDMGKCSSTDGNEDGVNLNLACTSKIQCYKHDRNERLNYILNLLLALVVASAVGLGTGHFLGWSHKCFRSATKTSKAADALTLSDKVISKQVLDSIQHPKTEVMSELVLSENLSNSFSCLNPEEGRNSAQQKICHVAMNHDITTDISKFPVKMSADILDKIEEMSPQNESGSHIVSFPLMSSMNSRVSWNELSVIEDKVKELTDMIKMSSVNSIQSDKENNFKFELFQEKRDGKLFTDTRIISKPSAIRVKDELSVTKVDDQFELLKQFSFGGKNVLGGSDFTSQLRTDLNEVIQSLSAIALTRLVHAGDKHLIALGDSGLIMKLYNDFHNLINSRITFIDTFISNPEYKQFQKVSQNYLQKMVYTLVDSVDYLMRVSFKTLNRESSQINTNKFSNNVSKVIFNFNKKWEKNYKHWFEAVERAKFSESKVNIRKENREWRKKISFEKNIKNHKYKRNTMKS